MAGIEEKRKPTGNVDRTDRLRCCREQGTMGAGTVLTQRGQALLSSWSVESTPTSLFYNATSQISS